jgi:hypothetical protein
MLNKAALASLNSTLESSRSQQKMVRLESCIEEFLNEEIL